MPDWRTSVSSLFSTGPWRTRFAPAPTGQLHLGHLVNAIHVWGLARAHGGTVILRIEDHDRTRCRPEYETALLDDLDWLGFAPDAGGTASYRAIRSGHPQRQSDNGPRYAAALDRLHAAGLVFPCTCTRREIARLAPSAVGEEPRYPGTCREAGVAPTATLARRIVMAPGVESFEDVRLGARADEPALQCGDLLARDRHGGWTYQFAVVVDDLDQQVDLIIRGEDLLASTARQQRLARLLGGTSPRVLHHSLLVHADGAKLSKARADRALSDYRAAGVRPSVLIGEAAYLAGLTSHLREMSVTDVPELFA